VDDTTLLAESELFESWAPDDLDQIVAEAGELHLQRGDSVFDEGAPADRMFAIRQGRVAIARRSTDARESIVALMGTGDLFGDMSLFDGGHRTAGARAIEASELMVVPFAPVRQILGEHPTLLWPMAALLCRRVRIAEAALADSLLLDVAGRTAKRLLELAGSTDEFSLPITQEELAGMVGASRERVNKSLAQFTRLGWLAVTDRRYRILKRDDLALRAR